MSTKPQSFSDEIIALREEYKNKIGADDLRHLNRIIYTNRLFFLIGCCFSWIYPNPISMICFSLYFMSNWCTVAHHILHGAYSSFDRLKNSYNATHFAGGRRRFLDWNDWFLPKAWCFEHNVLHHYYTNEPKDPDRVADVVKYGNIKNPFSKRLLLGIYIAFWKPAYYTFSTIKALKLQKNFNHNQPLLNYLKPVIFHCFIPYITINFIIFPLLFYPLGTESVFYVFINRLGAEVLTNIHTFFIIVPNHTGDDLTNFKTHFSNKDEFFLRQVQSTCNYTSKNQIQDYLYGHLNFQIEHHLFPENPPSQYRELSYKVKEICRKHEIHYQEQPITKRIKKTIDVCLQQD